MIHMNSQGQVISSSNTVLFNSRDVFVHQEDEPIYLCVFSNTTQKINVELIPNLMLPDQESFPTSDDADKLHRSLFITNSKMMELINQQIEFENSENEGMRVTPYNIQANIRVEDGLRNTLYLELIVVVVIAVVQYYILRSFANRMKHL